MVAAFAVEDQTVQERRQVLQAYRAAMGAVSAHWEVLPASTVDYSASESVVGVASAAVTEEQVCSAALAEPVV